MKNVGSGSKSFTISGIPLKFYANSITTSSPHDDTSEGDLIFSVLNMTGDGYLCTLDEPFVLPLSDLAGFTYVDTAPDSFEPVFVFTVRSSVDLNDSKLISCSMVLTDAYIVFRGVRYYGTINRLSSAAYQVVVRFVVSNDGQYSFDNGSCVLHLCSTFSGAYKASYDNPPSLVNFPELCRVDHEYACSIGSDDYVYRIFEYYDSDVVRSSDITNQTTSINNNTTSQITNQTTSINNNITQQTQQQTNTLTNGFDNSSMNNANASLSSSLTGYDQKEGQVLNQGISYIDGATFIKPSSNATILASISFCTSWLQSLFVNLGDWSLLVTVSLSLSLGLMLIGWFKYR